MSDAQDKPLPTPETHPLIFRLSREMNAPLAFFDLETTTNIVTANDFGITEFAFVAIMPNGQAHRHSKLINPENEISARASEVSGITQEMVKDAPTFEQHYGPIYKMMERSIMVGFNSDTFDTKALFKEIGRYNLARPATWKSVDLRSMWKKINGQKGKLVEVAEHYGVPFDGAHRALADAAALPDVLEQMLWRHGLDLWSQSMRLDWDGFSAPANDGKAAPSSQRRAPKPEDLTPTHLELKAAIDDCRARGGMSVKAFADELLSKRFTIEVTRGGAAYIFDKGGANTARISGSHLGAEYAWAKVRADFSGDIPQELFGAGPAYGANRQDRQQAASSGSREADEARAKEAALAAAEGGGRVDMAAILASDPSIKAASLSFAVGNLLAAGSVTVEQVSSPSAQAWLSERWDSLPTQGKLTPLLKACQDGGCPSEVDFLQLRVAIASRKASMPERRPAQRPSAPSSSFPAAAAPAFDEPPPFDDIPFDDDVPVFDSEPTSNAPGF